MISDRLALVNTSAMCGFLRTPQPVCNLFPTIRLSAVQSIIRHQISAGVKDYTFSMIQIKSSWKNGGISLLSKTFEKAKKVTRETKKCLKSILPR
jgi:hypothetical protein